MTYLAIYIAGGLTGIAGTILADAWAKRNAKRITEALLHGERAQFAARRTP